MIDPEDIAYEDSVSSDTWEDYNPEDYPHDENESLNPLIGYGETEL